MQTRVKYEIHDELIFRQYYRFSLYISNQLASQLCPTYIISNQVCLSFTTMFVACFPAISLRQN
jgi:hypothetical protein